VPTFSETSGKFIHLGNHGSSEDDREGIEENKLRVVENRVRRILRVSVREETAEI
jgi:hypothetical protein